MIILYIIGYYTPHKSRLGIAPLDKPYEVSTYCMLWITDYNGKYGPPNDWCLNPTKPWKGKETEQMVKILQKK